MRLMNYEISIHHLYHPRWYECILPRRLTLKGNRPIYKWFWFVMGKSRKEYLRIAVRRMGISVKEAAEALRGLSAESLRLSESMELVKEHLEKLLKRR